MRRKELRGTVCLSPFKNFYSNRTFVNASQLGHGWMRVSHVAGSPRDAVQVHRRPGPVRHWCSGRRHVREGGRRRRWVRGLRWAKREVFIEKFVVKRGVTVKIEQRLLATLPVLIKVFASVQTTYSTIGLVNRYFFASRQLVPCELCRHQRGGCYEKLNCMVSCIVR